MLCAVAVARAGGGATGASGRRRGAFLGWLLWEEIGAVQEGRKILVLRPRPQQLIELSLEGRRAREAQENSKIEQMRAEAQAERTVVGEEDQGQEDTKPSSRGVDSDADGGGGSPIGRAHETSVSQSLIIDESVRTSPLPWNTAGEVGADDPDRAFPPTPETLPPGRLPPLDGDDSAGGAATCVHLLVLRLSFSSSAVLC